jgi:hypothetical protein
MADKKKVGKVMREFEEGKLHSGSDEGPVVTDPAQAKAIAMSEAGLSKKHARPRTPPATRTPPSRNAKCRTYTATGLGANPWIKKTS